MRNCRSCAAPNSDTAEACSHCGVKIEPPFSWKDFVRRACDNRRPSELTCPACKTPLTLCRYGPLAIDECDACKGIWFDKGELEPMILRYRSEKTAVLGAAAVAQSKITRRYEGKFTYRNCVRCATIMNRMNYGGRSGVMIDYCGRCGVWLDGEEFQRMVDFLGTNQPPALPEPANPAFVSVDYIENYDRGDSLMSFLDDIFGR